MNVRNANSVTNITAPIGRTSNGDPFLTTYRLFCEIGYNRKREKKK